jgi:hypothetical protein
MSDVTSILTSKVDIKRFTASVIDGGVVVSSIPASRAPGRTGKIEVTLQGCAYNNGVVTINGNTAEQLTFAADGTKCGQTDFSTFAGLSLSGITGGWVSARAVSDMGQPINQQVSIAAGLSVRFFQNMGYQREFDAGQQLVNSRRGRMGMMMEPDGNIAQNDWVYSDYGIVGLTVMKVDFFEALYDFAGATHHLEAWLVAI